MRLPKTTLRRISSPCSLMFQTIEISKNMKSKKDREQLLSSSKQITYSRSFSDKIKQLMDTKMNNLPTCC